MKLKEQILKLRKKGFPYSKIAKKLNCSKSTIAYYCNSSTKSKIIKRNKALRKTVAGILYGKIGNFFQSVDRALPYKLKKEKKKSRQTSILLNRERFKCINQELMMGSEEIDAKKILGLRIS